MSLFRMYFELGIHHIIDLRGYDHILFIVTLSAVYLLRQWRHVLILVTAFTIGHSVTLALATLNIIHISTVLVEILIPVTILITSIFNITYKPLEISHKFHIIKYFTALFFGLIHGLGFSSYLRGLLGDETAIIKPLFAFNIGLEFGQIIIVSVIMLLSYIFVIKGKALQREWNLVTSGAGLGVSIILIIERCMELL